MYLLRHDFFNEEISFIINLFKLTNFSLLKQHSFAKRAHSSYIRHQILDIGSVLIVIVADIVAKFFVFIATTQYLNGHITAPVTAYSD